MIISSSGEASVCFLSTNFNNIVYSKKYFVFNTQFKIQFYKCNLNISDANKINSLYFFSKIKFIFSSTK